MFGPLGFAEVTFILVLALLIFGPRKLPEIGRTIGKAMGEFRRATTDLKRSIEDEVDLEERKSKTLPATTTTPARSTGATPTPAEKPASQESG
jgi:TatA/E family protein of Tat protein translocase